MVVSSHKLGTVPIFPVNLLAGDAESTLRIRPSQKTVSL